MMYRHYASKDSPPTFLNLLKTWIEEGAVKTRTKTTTKLADRGVPFMMVGYNILSGACVYRMWNPTTNNIHNSSDVICLKRMYYPINGNAPLIDVPTFRDIEVREGIEVINTTTTANDTQDGDYKSSDK